MVEKFNVDPSKLNANNLSIAPIMDKINKVCSNYDELINKLEKIRKIAEGEKETIQKVWQIKQKNIDTLEKQISNLDKTLQSLIKAANNDYKIWIAPFSNEDKDVINNKEIEEWFGILMRGEKFDNNKTESNNFGQTITSLIYKITAAPPIPTGYLAELNTAYALSYSKEFAAKVCGNEGGIPAMLVDAMYGRRAIAERFFNKVERKTDIKFQQLPIEDQNILSKQIVSKYKNNGNQRYIEATFSKTPDKIDVTATAEQEILLETLKIGQGEEVDLSVKNTSDASSKIHLVSGTHLMDLIQAENKSDFVNHYINIMATKYIWLTGFNNKARKESTEAAKAVSYGINKQDATDALDRLIVAKAMSGYGIYKSYNGVLATMKPAQYMAFNIRKQDQGGRYIVRAMGDFYEEVMKTQSYIINDGKGSNPFPQKRFYTINNTNDVNARRFDIGMRISKTLSYLHKKSIYIAIDKSKFSYF